MDKQDDRRYIDTPLPKGGAGGRLNFKFLLKPVFFIFSLVFSTWLVLTIEKITPSDFGRYKSFFESEAKPVHKPNTYNKQYLKHLCSDYKAGLIDSVKLDEQLEQFLKSPEKFSEITSGKKP